MKHTPFKTFTATGAALLLAGCNAGGGTADDSASGDTGGDDPVYAAMSGWNACEVLDNLQPVTDFMAIEGYGSSTSEGGEPGNSEIGNTFDPDAIGCNGLISIAAEKYADMMGGGEIKVKIVPTEGEDQAATTYEERSTSAETEASSGQDATTAEVGGPWDEGVLVAWTGSAEANWLEVVARDGQWVFHIQLNYDTDLGLRNEDTPAYQFTNEELHQWLTDTYLPEVNQVVNDKIAEVQ
jgi:hypothetical protein